jgi:hypothetical protein
MAGNSVALFACLVVLTATLAEETGLVKTSLVKIIW